MMTLHSQLGLRSHFLRLLTLLLVLTLFAAALKCADLDIGTRGHLPTLQQFPPILTPQFPQHIMSSSSPHGFPQVIQKLRHICTTLAGLSRTDTWTHISAKRLIGTRSMPLQVFSPSQNAQHGPARHRNGEPEVLLEEGERVLLLALHE